ncbi:MAG: hypothetical protein LBI64_04005 [Coriobacteriales bacterium]|jgi:YegS/Rv2252/BmrU family lipid kinase|nr:hypothetical protein [Coriobacteriales bacterium]
MNPTAGADRASAYREEVTTGLSEYFPDSRIELLHTESAEDPALFGSQIQSELILCLSGDGTIHGVLQGLMRRPRTERPALCVLPLGSGNDIARTFSIPTSPTRALPALARGYLQAADVGSCIPDHQDEVYFLQTLSFGMDAAIALKTIELRKHTRNREAVLYARAAVDAIVHELHTNHFHYVMDGQERRDDLLIMAIQNGPTYGGGFRVAPQARIDDGRLNLCMATRIGKLRALYYLSRMKNGTHEHLASFQTHEIRHLIVETDKQVPTQIDGEPIRARHYEISVRQNAIDFLRPA